MCFVIEFCPNGTLTDYMQLPDVLPYLLSRLIVCGYPLTLLENDRLEHGCAVVI